MTREASFTRSARISSAADLPPAVAFAHVRFQAAKRLLAVGERATCQSPAPRPFSDLLDAMSDDSRGWVRREVAAVDPFPGISRICTQIHHAQSHAGQRWLLVARNPDFLSLPATLPLFAEWSKFLKQIQLETDLWAQADLFRRLKLAVDEATLVVPDVVHAETDLLVLRDPGLQLDRLAAPESASWSAWLMLALRHGVMVGSFVAPSLEETADGTVAFLGGLGAQLSSEVSRDWCQYLFALAGDDTRKAAAYLSREIGGDEDDLFRRIRQCKSAGASTDELADQVLSHWRAILGTDRSPPDALATLYRGVACMHLHTPTGLRPGLRAFRMRSLAGSIRDALKEAITPAALAKSGAALAGLFLDVNELSREASKRGEEERVVATHPVTPLVPVAFAGAIFLVVHRATESILTGPYAVLALASFTLFATLAYARRSR